MARTGLGAYFEQIFVSEELGANKPSPLFFEKAFRRIPDFEPARVMMVGDSLTSDILGGIQAGIRTCWVNTRHRAPRQEIRPDFEIEQLAQLEKLLEKL
jgi:2-haloacid dehalogenase